MKLHKYVTLIMVAIALTVATSNAQVKQNISDQQLTDLLSRIDTSTDSFAKAADKAMDKSGFNKSAREDELNAHVKRLKTATEALKNDHTAANAKSNFETVLHHGVAIENFLRRNPLDGVEEEWTALRSDLGDPEIAPLWRDLEKLKVATARVGEGDFAVRADIPSRSLLSPIAVAFNGLSVFGAPTWFQPIFKGGILVLAVGLSTLARRYAKAS